MNASTTGHETSRERQRLLRQLENLLELPLVVLGFVWLALLVFELTSSSELAPGWERVSTGIWIVFVTDFVIKAALAPAKLRFLRENWLAAVSLLLPALRVFRFARVVRMLRLGRAVRAMRFARILTGLNRGLRSLRATMRRRGLGYVIALTGLVALAGAAGMYAFEHQDGQTAGFSSYAASLWWTLMLLTTMGSEYWPKTDAGRALCLLLSIYGFAVFGYITAALASFFVDQDVSKSIRER